MKKIALIGYSGHALVVAELIIETGYTIIGYLEKEEVKSNPLKIPYLGFERDENLLEKIKNILVFPAIGDNTIRSESMMFMKSRGFTIPKVISFEANISATAMINDGTLVVRGACINTYALIGRGVIINTAAVIDHECQIGDFVHIAPGAVILGNVKIGEGTFVGANAIVKQGVKIGDFSVIGAGSVVLEDVPNKSTYVGNPARLKNG